MITDTSNAPNEDSAHVEELIRELSAIRGDLIDLERREAGRVSELPESHQASARNLLHYLALRRHDLRPLQEQLARLGLSSLGRTESHVLATVDAVLNALDHVSSKPRQPLESLSPRAEFRRGDRPARQPTLWPSWGRSRPSGRCGSW